MKNWSKICVILGMAFSQAAIAAPDDGGSIRYQVVRGDTLFTLADHYLLHPQDYLLVQKQNKIADPLKLPVGKNLFIPRNLLKFQTAKAIVQSVRGQVSVSGTSIVGGLAKSGQSFGEGVNITTAQSSFISFSLDDGSHVAIPSNSNVTIKTLRKYILGGSIDYDFAINNGAARSTVVPLKSSDDQYRMRSPRAVSAVRGTDFETRYDDKTGQDYAEVVIGRLAVSTGTNSISDVSAGNGLALSKSGDPIKETLLAAPQVQSPSKLQADDIVQFHISKENGQAGYHVSIAEDAGFLNQIDEQTSANDVARFAALPNGNYFIRAKAISANGVEGMPATYAFKRRLNGITAQTSKDASGYKFAWAGSGDGVKRYHFQIFRNSTDSTPIVDEPNLTGQNISISDMPPADYYWRLGSSQYLDGEKQTNWTAFEKLTVAPS